MYIDRVCIVSSKYNILLEDISVKIVCVRSDTPNINLYVFSKLKIPLHSYKYIHSCVCIAFLFTTTTMFEEEEPLPILFAVFSCVLCSHPHHTYA